MGMEVIKITGNVSAAENTEKNKIGREKPKENLSELLSNPVAKKSSEKELDTAIEETDKSKNGKFDVSEALWNFGKGLISPITVLFKHPVLSAAILGGTIYACLLAPVLAPILTVVFGGISLYQLGSGIYQAIQNYNSGKYDDAERSFDTIGQGVIGTALSALSIKPSAKVVREAKILSAGGEITPEIAPQLLKSGFLTNLKEVGSLFTTKNGLKAMYSQLRPSALAAKFKKGVFLDLLRSEKGKKATKEETVTRDLTTEEQIAKFQQTAEGIRRANMTEEQIQQEVVAMSERIFDKLGIPKSQRPQIEIVNNSDSMCGCYIPDSHTLEFNIQSYKNGFVQMEDLLMHEATHCKEALLRAGIPQERVQEIVTRELLAKLKNGEAEKYPTGQGAFIGAKLEDVPKMSAQMREDLYQVVKRATEANPENSRFYVSEKDLRALIERHPEFAKQYANEHEAFKDMDLDTFIDFFKNEAARCERLNWEISPEQEANLNALFKIKDIALNKIYKYVSSFGYRYSHFTNTKIVKRVFRDFIFCHEEEIKVPELTGQALKEAEKSLVDTIETIEGNLRISGVNGLFEGKKGFYQYQFSPEEILAEKNGQSYLIETLTERLNQIKSGKIKADESEITYLQKLIEKAKAIIEYRTKGQLVQKKHVEAVNNPENPKLAKEVQKMESELLEMEKRLFSEEQVTETKMIEYDEPKFVVEEKVKAPLPITYKFLEGKQQSPNK